MQQSEETYTLYYCPDWNRDPGTSSPLGVVEFCHTYGNGGRFVSLGREGIPGVYL